MSADGLTPSPARARTARVLRAGVALGVVAALASCRLLTAPNLGSSSNDRDVAVAVVAAAGWTRVATTEHYIVIANVLPGERMFTAAEAKAEHPTVGELIIDGPGTPLGPNVRHVEAHIYGRDTGLPLTGTVPTIVLLNRTSGEQIDVPTTLMQDVNIGALDIHFGNNVAVAGDSDISLTITIGDEEVTLDGHLD